MNCVIEWNTYTRIQWNNLLKKCHHATLLQSYYYAQAIREIHKQGVRHGLIKIDGIEAGIVQVQEVKLFGQAIHGISIDRGPLWFDGFGKADHLNVFAETLNSQFPNRFGRKRRVIYEFFDKKHLLNFKNWKKINKSKEYKTFFINISKEIDNLRGNLKKNWRNVLNKAEKNNLSIEIDEKLSTLGALLQNYLHDRMEKRYAGASPKFLASLSKFAAMNKQCFILNAVEDGETIASILIYMHGNGATYQVGWTTPYGREKGASHLLLWQAIKILKERGITEFDLGGHNDDTEGLYTFKKGLGGQEIALIGSYS